MFDFFELVFYEVFFGTKVSQVVDLEQSNNEKNNRTFHFLMSFYSESKFWFQLRKFFKKNVLKANVSFADPCITSRVPSNVCEYSPFSISCLSTKMLTSQLFSLDSTRLKWHGTELVNHNSRLATSSISLKRWGKKSNFYILSNSHRKGKESDNFTNICTVELKKTVVAQQINGCENMSKQRQKIFILRQKNIYF